MKEIKQILESMEYGEAPESADEALHWIDKHKARFKLFIGGEWVPSAGKKTFTTLNPCDKQVLAEVAEGNAKDIDRAVNAAKKAFATWKNLSGHQRARYLYALARQIQKNARLFAVLEALDNGKTIRETRDIDIPLAARHFYYHTGWAQLQENELSEYSPLGVVGQIIPWNFPLLMLSWKIAPALAMGNTVVLKPAEQTPLTALLFAELCERIGLPKGVVNIVTGDGSTGAALVSHPEVRKIAFTGSTAVGKEIRRSIAGSGKKLSLELGGKSPFIIFDDADLDGAVEGIVDAIWFNQGEVCCAGSRLLVQESISEVIYEKIRRRMESLRVGNALDKSVDMGAIVSEEQLKTVTRHVAEAEKAGGRLWQPSWKCPTNGFYFPPTLFTDIAPSDKIAEIEVFGPVLVAMTFRTHEEAVALANNTRYGLAASIWTENINLALDLAPKIKAGTVWINCTNSFDAASGFGGYRESGFGREGGREGLFEYLKPKMSGFSKDPSPRKMSEVGVVKSHREAIDRTAKLYIGGKQVRPDNGYSFQILNTVGIEVGEVAHGSRKDVRDAVEAAHAGQRTWGGMTGHSRAQILYFLAENLEARKQEFTNRLLHAANLTKAEAEKEVRLSIDRIFTFAAIADKYDGRVHSTLQRNITLAMPEAIGVVAVVCPDEFPLLGFISTVMLLVAMGNTVVALPSESSPFSATDLYQVMDTSDIPPGCINIITGPHESLTEIVASHDDIDGIWYFGTGEGSKKVETLAADNMKRSWVNYGKHLNWAEKEMQMEEFIRNATQIKNIWIPYGA